MKKLSFLDKVKVVRQLNTLYKTLTKETNGMKPGIATTEFWTALIGGLAGIGISTGMLPSDFPQTQLAQVVQQVAGAVLAIVVMVKYLHDRTHLKATVAKTIGAVATNGACK